jgi:hypothetical protein
MLQTSHTRLTKELATLRAANDELERDLTLAHVRCDAHAADAADALAAAAAAAALLPAASPAAAAAAAAPRSIADGEVQTDPMALDLGSAGAVSLELERMRAIEEQTSLEAAALIQKTSRLQNELNASARQAAIAEEMLVGVQEEGDRALEASEHAMMELQRRLHELEAESSGGGAAAAAAEAEAFTEMERLALEQLQAELEAMESSKKALEVENRTLRALTGGSQDEADDLLRAKHALEANAQVRVGTFRDTYVVTNLTPGSECEPLTPAP